MIHVRLGEDGRRAWSTWDGASVRGYAFRGSEFHEDAGLAATVGTRPLLTEQWHTSKEQRNTGNFRSSDGSRLRGLAELNGSFSVVHHDAHRLEAAVDRVRSTPLFYGVRGADFFLSDDASSVRRQVQDDAIDDVAAAEFQMTGYVTGSDTL